MVTGLPTILPTSKVCEECVVSKQQRSQFPNGKSWRAKDVLELVHSDICGPIKPSSSGGKRYLITFTNDFSRKTWVRVENERGKNIKSFRTDRGEYCSNEFKAFCEEHVIRRELTTAYTPQQNGVSERKNRTILNMVRSLFSKERDPKSFWPEVVNWSTHVLNRSPTFAIQNMTPEEGWSRRKSYVDHFRIFGCIAYAHVPDQKRKKLDDKAEKCVFLGVSDLSKAYKLFNPLTKKIVINRDVVFDEENTWDWNRQQPTQLSLDYDTEEEPISAENSSSNSPNMAETMPAVSEQQESEVLSSTRVRRRPAWFEDYEVTGVDDPMIHFALFSDCDPTTFESAVKVEKWQKAMNIEMDAIERNDTWELCDLPDEHKAIGVRWVFKTKLKENGEVDKYKARLVAKGYKQEYGINYTEVFSPLASHDTIRLVVALAPQNSWPIFQLDVKSAFLHEHLKEQKI